MISDAPQRQYAKTTDRQRRRHFEEDATMARSEIHFHSSKKAKVGSEPQTECGIHALSQALFHIPQAPGSFRQGSIQLPRARLREFVIESPCEPAASTVVIGSHLKREQ